MVRKFIVNGRKRTLNACLSWPTTLVPGTYYYDNASKCTQNKTCISLPPPPTSPPKKKKQNPALKIGAFCAHSQSHMTAVFLWTHTCSYQLSINVSITSIRNWKLGEWEAQQQRNSEDILCVNTCLS